MDTVSVPSVVRVLCVRAVMVLVYMSVCAAEDADSVVQLRGAGASFPSSVYYRWLPAYKAWRSDYVNVHTAYDAIGSGNGKRRIMGVTSPPVEYAGSDSELGDADYTAFPDLQMFPTMAGAVVLGYNLPGVVQLNLTRDHVVGIYNGTYTRWNDPELQSVNSVPLPDIAIVVIARADKSGTTELFTTALSAFNEDWRQSFGAFSTGLGDDDVPDVWDPNVIRYYGQTTRGVSGLILSLRYSIGYLALSDARSFGIKYARLANRAGRLVDASIETVQAAMDYYAQGFSERMTSTLSDAMGEDAYPIAGYTYFIVHMTNMVDCRSAMELYRYVEWFLYQDDPHEACIDMNMVPLSTKVADLVMEVLQSMRCAGVPVHSMVAQQVFEENRVEEKWRTPFYVCLPFMLALVLGAPSFFLWQTWKTNLALIREEWKIPSDQVQLERRQISPYVSSNLPSMHSDAVSQATHASLGSMTEDGLLVLRLGKYQGLSVTLRWSGVVRMAQLRRPGKKQGLVMKNTMTHGNILKFLGFTEINRKPWLVSEFCSKGTLKSVLVRERAKLDETFKFSLATDVTSGIEYLHKQDFIHGCLTTANCYVDSKWVVKVADWEYNTLAANQRNRRVFTWSKKGTVEDDVAKIRSRLLYAPEVILEDNRPPTRSGDIYSVALVIYEVFTLTQAYDSVLRYRDERTVYEFLRTGELRPEPSDEMSDELHQLLELCWSPAPKQRPSAGRVVKILKQINPSTKSVMDCMMERLEERTKDLKGNMKKFADLLTQMLPPTVADSLIKGSKVEPESFTSVTVYFSDIMGFAEISAESSPFELVDLLNDLYSCFDDIIEKHQVYKVETICDTYMVVSGLPKRNGVNHAAYVADMAFDFARASIHLTIRHRPKEQLRLRIGMHSGPVLAGVVGLKMPRYCLFGDTVNTASRMESTSSAQKIQVSDTTFHLLQMLGGYVMKQRGEVFVKGKGQLKTYWLNGKDGDPSALPDVFKRDLSPDELNLAGK